MFGYALGDSLTIERNSQFNVAEAGAISEDMPYMADVLIRRIKNDPRVKMNEHWKVRCFSKLLYFRLNVD